MKQVVLFSAHHSKQAFQQKQKHFPPLKLHLFSAEEIMAGEFFFFFLYFKCNISNAVRYVEYFA